MRGKLDAWEAVDVAELSLGRKVCDFSKVKMM